jgi:Flp pilus assembly protein TadB
VKSFQKHINQLNNQRIAIMVANSSLGLNAQNSLIANVETETANGRTENIANTVFPIVDQELKEYSERVNAEFANKLQNARERLHNTNRVNENNLPTSNSSTNSLQQHKWAILGGISGLALLCAFKVVSCWVSLGLLASSLVGMFTGSFFNAKTTPSKP